ncbi:MAG: polysulfide reductase NrfD [Myxococcales bacterium]|nr:polysulfide reductase NrfD [Myxococcales bacterium]
MGTYLRYWRDMIRTALVGPRLYYAWLAALALVIAGGTAAYVMQLQHGLIVTNLSDQVSWGAYIANFTFLVGVAAAAVLLVVPSYVYHRADVKEVVLIGELLAVSAIVMCLAFVTVDIGRPDRVLHMLPGFGQLNFPSSILAWDVVVLSGYLALNMHIPGYLLYRQYLGKPARKRAYLPLVFLSIFWAVSIHTVTAFLYSGLGGRPFWNTAILAPRFLVSAFASGPSILIIVLLAIDKWGPQDVKWSVIQLLRRIVTVMLPLNFFLLGCEVFKEFYTDAAHVISAEYLFFGIGEHATLVPYIWSGLAMSVVGLSIFIWLGERDKRGWLVGASALVVVGVWIEKGMGLVVPGFLPTPAGDLVEYSPSWIEFFVSLGIWALGAFIFTVLAKVALAIQSGSLRHPSAA